MILKCGNTECAALTFIRKCNNIAMVKFVSLEIISTKMNGY